MAAVGRRAPRARSDVYTGLLALSLLAMIAACALLYMDYSQYGGNKKGPDLPAAPAPVTPGGAGH